MATRLKKSRQHSPYSSLSSSSKSTHDLDASNDDTDGDMTASLKRSLGASPPPSAEDGSISSASVSTAKASKAAAGASTEAVSNFQYAPTVVALLPIFCSLIFGSHSEHWTDLMLLILVAIYLHNCVTVPWDYYRHSTLRLRSYDTKTMTLEQRGAFEALQRATRNAFLGLVIGPVLGAALLHYIRSALDRPANGLISNFNIGVFVLAAEIRPMRIAYKYLVSRSDKLQKQLVDAPESQYDQLRDQVGLLHEQIEKLQRELDHYHQGMNGITNGNAAGKAALSRRESTAAAQVQAVASAAAQEEVEALKRAMRRYERHEQQLKDQWEERLQLLEMSISRQRDESTSPLRSSPPSMRRVSFRNEEPRSTSAPTKGRKSFIRRLSGGLLSILAIPIKPVWFIISIPARLANLVGSM